MVSESREWWWFGTSGCRWSRSRIKSLLRNLWAGDGGGHPDSRTSRSESPNLVPPMPCPIIKHERSHSSQPVSTTPGLSHAAGTSTFLPWYTPLPQLPLARESPQSPREDFIPNICCKCLKCPLSWGFLFFFFLKVKPTKPKILWIPPKSNLWRCNIAYPSITEP